MTGPQHETWYVWKEAVAEPDGTTRLVTPWGDPDLYEAPFDYQFTTAEEALAFRAEYDAALDEDWVLVKVSFEPVALAPTD
jgi:hypothetical protein